LGTASTDTTVTSFHDVFYRDTNVARTSLSIDTFGSLIKA